MSKKTLKKHNSIYIGIDVGGTAIKFGVFEYISAKSKKLHSLDVKDKRLMDKFSVDTFLVKEDNEKHLMNYIFDVIDNYCKNNHLGIDKKQIKGIGFAVPGPVVNNKLLHAVNINWTRKCDIETMVKERYGKNIKVKVLNDANAACIGEYEYAFKDKYNSMCLITLGTGAGTGIIIDGKLIEGKSGIAGEISHIRIDYSDEAKKCNCGNVGCIETVASCRGVIEVYNRIVAKSKKMQNIVVEDDVVKKSEVINENLDELYSTKEIINRAKAGNVTAEKALNISLGYVSSMIAILMHVFEPEVVVIGGGMSNAGAFITNIIEKHLKEKIFMTKTFPKIVIAKLKNDAGIIGAVVDL